MMGFSRRRPKDPELTEAQLAEKERLKKEKESQEFQASEQKRYSSENLIGSRSLLGQDDDINFSGFRRMGKSIRS